MSLWQNTSKKIVFQELSEPVYRIILPVREAEIYRFLWSCLAWYSLYFSSVHLTSQMRWHCSNAFPKPPPWSNRDLYDIFDCDSSKSHCSLDNELGARSRRARNHNEEETTISIPSTISIPFQVCLSVFSCKHATL